MLQVSNKARPREGGDRRKDGPAPIIGHCPQCGLSFTSRYGRKHHMRPPLVCKPAQKSEGVVAS